jgi:hypothetical protein
MIAAVPMRGFGVEGSLASDIGAQERVIVLALAVSAVLDLTVPLERP